MGMAPHAVLDALPEATERWNRPCADTQVPARSRTALQRPEHANRRRRVTATPQDLI